MKIAYKKRHLNVNLIFGLFWLVLFAVSVYVNAELSWTDYSWLVIALMDLGLHLYQKIYGYLTLENGLIKVNQPFGKQLKLTEIKRIKKFAGDYILKTDQKELTINTQIIAPSSLVKLDEELKKLQVKWL